MDKTSKRKMDKYLATLQDLQSKLFKNGSLLNIKLGAQWFGEYYCIDASLFLYKKLEDGRLGDFKCRSFQILSFYDEERNNSEMERFIETMKAIQEDDTETKTN